MLQIKIKQKIVQIGNTFQIIHTEYYKLETLLSLINLEPDIENIYLYSKDPYESKCQFLINKREKVGLNYCIDLKASIEYSTNMQDVYNKIKEENPRRNVKY